MGRQVLDLECKSWGRPGCARLQVREWTVEGVCLHSRACNDGKDPICILKRAGHGCKKELAAFL